MSKYFYFKTLASRQQFWAVMLIGHAALFVMTMVFVALAASGPTGEMLGGLGLLVVAVAYIWGILATCARRCRDAGINPWWTVATLLPYVGYITVIVIGVLRPANQPEVAEV